MPRTEQESQGDRIARLRRALGLSQAELAVRVGVNASQISKYERNAYEPKIVTLSRLAEVLGTSTDYLITGREAPPAEPDRLLALWPFLAQLPPGLRNEIAGFPDDRPRRADSRRARGAGLRTASPSGRQNPLTVTVAFLPM